MRSRTVRAGRPAVIGTGFVGPHHVDGIRRAGYADVVALGGTDQARVSARAASLGVPRATTDLGWLLDDAEIDVVHICTPNSTHTELALRALRGGRHVVVEKPMASTSADADTLVEAADRAGRHAAVAFTYRGYPQVRRARRMVAAGDIGDVRLVHGAYLQDWLALETDYNWRLEEDVSGAARAVADIGTHWFDTVEFVTGRRIESLIADLATFIPVRRRPAVAGIAFAAGSAEGEGVAIHTEDAATLLVRFVGGARGTSLISQISQGHKNAFSWEVAGSSGTLAWAQETPETLWLGRRDPNETRLLPRVADAESWPGTPSSPAGHPEGWGDAWRDLFRPFYRAIADGLPPPEFGSDCGYPTLQDGARAVRFVEAVLESLRSGGWASLG